LTVSRKKAGGEETRKKNRKLSDPFFCSEGLRMIRKRGLFLAVANLKEDNTLSRGIRGKKMKKRKGNRQNSKPRGVELAALEEFNISNIRNPGKRSKEENKLFQRKSSKVEGRRRHPGGTFWGLLPGNLIRTLSRVRWRRKT